MTTTVNDADLEALRIQRDRDRERMHQPVTTPYDAYRLLRDVILPNERRLSEECRASLLLHLATLVYAAPPVPVAEDCPQCGWTP